MLVSLLENWNNPGTLQSDGTCLVSSEVWYILASIGASSSAAPLRINAGMESGPMALNGFNGFLTGLAHNLSISSGSANFEFL